MTERSPSESELADLAFAWRAAKHIKSNTIVLAKGQALVGMGAGQPNRVNSVHLAGSRGRRAGLGDGAGVRRVLPLRGRAGAGGGERDHGGGAAGGQHSRRRGDRGGGQGGAGNGLHHHPTLPPLGPFRTSAYRCRRACSRPSPGSLRAFATRCRRACSRPSPGPLRAFAARCTRAPSCPSRRPFQSFCCPLYPSALGGPFRASAARCTRARWGTRFSRCRSCGGWYFCKWEKRVPPDAVWSAPRLGRGGVGNERNGDGDWAVGAALVLHGGRVRGGAAWGQ